MDDDIIRHIEARVNDLQTDVAVLKLSVDHLASNLDQKLEPIRKQLESTAGNQQWFWRVVAAAVLTIVVNVALTQGVL